jgi:hypothetical protein
MKIFTDSRKWDDRWFRNLAPDRKLIYLYICDLSDHAGIWEFDGDMLRLHLGVKYSDDEIIKKMDDLTEKVAALPDNKFWITNYIHFQNPKGISRRYKHCAPIYRSLDKHGIDPVKFQSALDVETEGDPPAKGDKDLQEIVDLWNSTCKTLSSVTKITPTRRSALRLIKKEEISVAELFKKVSESDFLMGRSSKWKASFDWVLKPQNRIKILEGNYANANRTGHSTEDYTKGF